MGLHLDFQTRTKSHCIKPMHHQLTLFGEDVDVNVDKGSFIPTDLLDVWIIDGPQVVEAYPVS